MGTSGQRIQLFYYTRYMGLGQSVFALQYENLQPRPMVLRGFRVCFAQPPLNKNRHRNLPAIRANLCACFNLFGQERIQRAGAGWIATARTGGVSRGEQRSPWREASKGGQRLPWHTTFPWKV